MTALQKRNRRPERKRAAEIEKDNLCGSGERYPNQEAKSNLSDEIVTEIARLDSAGFSLLPLGGADGKKPIVRFKDRDPIPRSVVVERMLASKSQAFGIRLPGMLVVDVDTDTAEAREYVQQRFGESTVQVRTSRGVHHYFRHDAPAPSAVRLPGIAIDIKAGSNQFVVAAGSIRRDGFQYLASVGRLQDVASLPEFVDRRPSELPYIERRAGKIVRGGRHKALLKTAVEYAPCEDSLPDLFANLLGFRNLEMEDPDSVSDDEVRDAAKWAWDLRCQNQLWAGRESIVKIRRSVMDQLLRRENGEEAFALYSVLQANHGHIPGRRFTIVPEGMMKAGLLSFSRNRIRRAVDTLKDEGLLLDHGQQGCNRAKLYQLSNGERSIHYLVTQNGTMGGEAA